jgi:hypothetical protein
VGRDRRGTRRSEANCREDEEGDVDLVDPRAEGVLEAAIEIVRAKAVDLQKGREDYLYTAGDRLKAAKVVLEFTRAKPLGSAEGAPMAAIVSPVSVCVFGVPRIGVSMPLGSSQTGLYDFPMACKPAF